MEGYLLLNLGSQGRISIWEKETDREVFKKGRTVQEQLEAKADEVLTWILRIEKISVVAPVSQKHKKGKQLTSLGKTIPRPFKSNSHFGSHMIKERKHHV
ncbi:hypothetical protein AV530_014307 [Patagioenas fasciata monilis]|uniref:Uncharacterized protein n=1 Tax=Patagioenas fasciata monilis TaxID=372326 RepID=A0A1V4KBH2_PATFA|nr:hypothetical protein AV530_014307 [Patagioenas fasciata monilis]